MTLMATWFLEELARADLCITAGSEGSGSQSAEGEDRVDPILKRFVEVVKKNAVKNLWLGEQII